MDNVYLFDLDSTVTREEILPSISKLAGLENEISKITEQAMMGEIPFEDNFRQRIKILSNISVKEASTVVEGIKLNEQIVKFIQQNKQKCFIVTSNLDAWINKLIAKIGMTDNLFCTKANIADDKITGVDTILKKEQIIGKFPNNKIIAIGDGNNDIKMLEQADVGIAFGGVRKISPKLLEVCDFAVYTEERICNLLNQIEGNVII